uniref:Ig-like domain-containing protein n=1 Tax=Spermophilus dauricus TaxID=99837 RepID=A0A8C9PZP6_SPEDA
MHFILILFLGIHYALRDSRAQSVTQPDRQVTISEGNSLELACNYSYGGSFSLFWYVQYPNQGLQSLLKFISGNTLVQGIKGFEAEAKKSESSFNLRKPSVHWSDSAEYFCSEFFTNIIIVLFFYPHSVFI